MIIAVAWKKGGKRMRLLEPEKRDTKAELLLGEGGGYLAHRQPGCNWKKNNPIARDKTGALYSTQITPCSARFQVEPHLERRAHPKTSFMSLFIF